MNLRYALTAALVLLGTTFCAPAPTAKVDLSKARATLQLADGSSISSDVDDDLNPILIQMPNGFLLLVFESNRDCAEGCSGFYNLFVAQSLEPVSDPYDLPAFDTPVALVASGSSPLNLSSTPFKYQAAWHQGQVYFVFQYGSSIQYLNATNIEIFSGFVSAAPNTVSNSSHNSDTLVSVDFRTLRMITQDGSGDLYESRMQDSSDTGTQIYNDELAYSNGATNVSVTISGYTDAKLYEQYGQLAYGFNDYAGDEMFYFNAALDEAGLELSYASAFETQIPFINALLFSAGEPGDQHDLYAVDSHTLDELWFLDADFGFEFEYTDNFNVFLTAFAVDGAMNFSPGIPGVGGITGADFICNIDDNRPVITSSYKALLVDTIPTRRACSTGNCTGGASENIDWVFQPSTRYIQADAGLVLQTTDTSGLLPFSFSTQIGSGSAWLGFAATHTWVTGTGTCSDWTDSVSGTGFTGDPTVISSTFLYDGTGVACASMAKLVCVEQPF